MNLTHTAHGPDGVTSAFAMSTLNANPEGMCNNVPAFWTQRPQEHDRQKLWKRFKRQYHRLLNIERAPCCPCRRECWFAELLAYTRQRPVVQ